VPQPIAIDTATLRALVDRLTRIADELAATPIPGIEALPGSALDSLDAPRRVADDVRRLSTDLQDWVCSARRSVDELAAADDIGSQRLSTQ
jgi:hypothetical protein